RPDTRRLAGGGSLGGPSPYAPTTRWHNRSQPRGRPTSSSTAPSREGPGDPRRCDKARRDCDSRRGRWRWDRHACARPDPQERQEKSPRRCNPQGRSRVGILLGHVPVSAEVARFPIRTGGEGEPHMVRLRARRWSGLGAAYGALLTQCREAIPIGAPRLEAIHLHMHRMRKPAVRFDYSGADHVAHRVVRGDIPRHRSRIRDAAQSIQRKGCWRQARPQHEAAVGWFTGRDAQRKRISIGCTRKIAADDEDRRKRARSCYELAPVQRRLPFGSIRSRPARVLARSEGFEPPTPRFEVWFSRTQPDLTVLLALH